jgi:hypothetical protein
MGAFDCELEALGYNRHRQVKSVRCESVYEEVEPALGLRVRVLYPNDDVVGEVVYVGESLVVVKRDIPKVKLCERTEYETAYPRHYTFYKATGESK